MISSNTAVVSMNEAELTDAELNEMVIGDLELPDGKLATMDPLVQPERPPFARTVASGSYPVSYIYPSYDPIPALMVIRFSDEPISDFELATIDGQDVSKLEGDQFFGFPVDAGLAAFANASFADAVLAREAKEKAANANYSNYYDDVLYEQFPGKGEFEHGVHVPVEGQAGAAAITRSGAGDGYYPTIWGLDKSGNPVLAYIDFFVIQDGDGRDPFQVKIQKHMATMTAEQIATNNEAFAALQAGNTETFGAHLMADDIAPQDMVLETGFSFVFEAIIADQPDILRLLIEHGATNEVGEYERFIAKTYSDYVRLQHDTAVRTKELGHQTGQLYSQPLMDVIEELERR